MKRTISIVVAVAVLFVGASPAFAGPVKDDKTKAPAPVSKTVNIFTKAAIDKAVAKSVAKATPAPAPRASSSFWKTPWPYVIIAGVVAAVVIVKSSDSNGGGIY